MTGSDLILIVFQPIIFFVIVYVNGMPVLETLNKLNSTLTALEFNYTGMLSPSHITI